MLGCLFVYYLMRALKVPDHSWYLTLYSSGVASFFGLYFFYHVCNDGFTAVLDNEHDITRYVAIFFIGYCIMDLALGSRSTTARSSPTTTAGRTTSCTSSSWRTCCTTT